MVNKLRLSVIIVALTSCAETQRQDSVAEEVQTYRSVDGVELKAHVFRPSGSPPGRGYAGAVLLHGGGWFMGEPGWLAERGRRLASLGMVAIALQYRLSDQQAITPLEAMADVRAGIRWMRTNAASLGIDPDRIAAIGVSAGGHLAMAAALIDADSVAAEPSSAANVFVLWYPALSLAGDEWLERILLGRVPVSSIDPVVHVKSGLGPALIFVGANDSLTPLAGQEAFCARMRQAGNACTIQVYPGLGHLFMTNPWGEGNEPPDSAARVDASARAERFMDSLGYFVRRPSR